ncbi:histidinol-phosphatase [Porcincola sp. LCP21S3_C12]|uniref:histidinol-phosphatase n=1 Tax=Porcincola sp. LCP21S3_C12 TaxID=3438798 RepID=UPI003F989F12
MLRANFHTHTTLCDGSSTPEDMARRAVSLGFTQLGFSGHMDPDNHMDMNLYRNRIHALQEQYRGKIDILIGIELDTVYNPVYARQVEYTIGSTHFPDVACNRGYEGAGLQPSNGGACEPEGGRNRSGSERPLSVDASPEDLQLLADRYFGGDFYQLARCYYETEAQVYDRLHCTFIGHFDLITKFNDQMHVLDETDPRYTRPALETMAYLAEEGVPFEINCGAVNRGLKREFYPNSFFLRALHDMGGEILINSDAHQAELLNGAFDRAVNQAAACGFTHTNILVHGENGAVSQRSLPLDTLL